MVIFPRSPWRRFWLGGLGLLTAVACLRAGVTDPGPVDLSTRESSRRWFLTWWPEGWGAPLEFTGDVDNGLPGDTGQRWKDQQCLRINTYRRLAGLQPVTFKPEYNAEAQAAAVLCAANDAITHDPPNTWKHWNEYAWNGCRHSLLGQNVPWSNTINDFIDDSGDNNKGLGHRLTLLDAPTKYFGTGDTPDVLNPDGSVKYYSTSAIFANDPSALDSLPEGTPDLILWPSSGFLPHCLLPAKWVAKIPDDLSTGTLSFVGAQVEVWRNGVALPVWTLELNAGTGITFTLNGTPYGVEGWSDDHGNVLPPQAGTPIHSETVYGFASEWEDVTYDVKISGIRVRATGALWKGTGDYTYRVTGYNHFRGAALDGAGVLTNISTRASLGGGDAVAIGGFVMAGTGSHRFLVRGVGPSLALFGLSQAAEDPSLTLWRGQEEVASNDDWSFASSEVRALAGDFARAGAFALPEASRDAALLASVAAEGPYTAQVRLPAGATGVGLVEIYDAEPEAPGPRLINLSSRTYVGRGEQVQIGGFVLRGQRVRTVLVRVSGPSLRAFGIQQPLGHPHLRLLADGAYVRQNDNWEWNATEAAVVKALASEVGAFPWSAGSGDAAVVAVLEPEVNHTVVVDDADGGEGVALLEVYTVP